MGTTVGAKYIPYDYMDPSGSVNLRPSFLLKFSENFIRVCGAFLLVKCLSSALICPVLRMLSWCLRVGWSPQNIPVQHSSNSCIISHPTRPEDPANLSTEGAACLHP